MHPGRACVDCHRSRGRGPLYTIAGTVYATGHDPDDCFGADGGGMAVVEITDATGAVTRLTPNAIPVLGSAGNFFSSAAIATPYTARVLYQGRVRAMLTPQTSGDCNSCHTAAGTTGAPGRIALP